MALQLRAVLLEHVEMMGAPWSALNEVVPARNAVLATVLVADIDQEKSKQKGFLEGFNGDGDIEDWLCQDAGDCRASDMLDIKCG